MATIELSLLQKSLGKQLAGIKGKIQSAFKGMSVGLGAVAGRGGIFGAAAAASFASLTANAGRLRNSLAQINALRFSGMLSLRNILIGSAAGASLLWPVKLAANIEVATAQLAVFTGSADTARAMLLELQKFSAVAIIPFENLSKTAALLLRYGQSAADAVANTKALAVIAAGDADEFDKLALAFAQVGSAGRLQGEEMRQFKNTGFNPLREIAERTGETMDQVKQRMEAGGVSFAEVSSALQAAVGPAGRFNGLLEAIAGTLFGQIRQAFAGLKMGLLPLGEQMLKPFTKFFKAINGAMPAIQAFIKANKEVYKRILYISFATGVTFVSLMALALTMGTLSFLFSGITAVIGAMAAVLMLLLNPITLLVAGIGFLVFRFTQLPNVVRNVFTNLGEWFGELLQIARDTFSGIGDALTAGDIQLAAEVVWAGLRLAWLTGTDGLRSIWLTFRNDFLQVILNLGAEIEKAWNNIWATMKTQMAGMAADSAAFFAGIGKSEADKAGFAKVAEISKAVFGSKFRNEAADANAVIVALQGVMEQVFSAKTQAELSAAKQALKDAEQRLKFLRLAAASGAEPKKSFGQMAGAVLPFDGAMAAAKKSTNPLPGLFDTRLASQIFGQSSNRELDQLKKIEKNTRRRGGGLPVV